MKYYLLSILLLFSCSETTPEKGEEDDALLPGKSDSFYYPTYHGAIAFGEETGASIGSDTKIHAWTFALSDQADIALQTSPDSSVDTVLYYYKKNPITNSWGPYVKKNDDYKENDWSKIEFAGEQGIYRVIVKAHSKTERGPFSLSVSCEGSGCADKGDMLRHELREIVSEEHIVLGYRGARDEMYYEGGIDVDNGRVEGIYTGRTVDADTTRVPSLNCTDLYGAQIECSLNTEHTFARHFLREHLIEHSPEFIAAESDIHHLFPADQIVNAKRGHFDFGVTDCDEKENCKVNEESKLGIPTGESGKTACTKGAAIEPGEFACVFQVRDIRKGDVARSQFYVAMRYGIPIPDHSEATMRE